MQSHTATRAALSMSSLPSVCCAALRYYRYQTGNQADGPYGINFTRTDFVEFFNLTRDTWQMNNLWHDPATSATQQELRTKLHAWFACAGDNCP